MNDQEGDEKGSKKSRNELETTRATGFEDGDEVVYEVEGQAMEFLDDNNTLQSSDSESEEEGEYMRIQTKKQFDKADSI